MERVSLQDTQKITWKSRYRICQESVFVDGDFWYGYNYNKLKPKLKNDFWVKKITRNIERDKEVNQKLKEIGWNVLRLWEHEINKDLGKCIKKIELRMK